jgi:hypothetical protein
MSLEGLITGRRARPRRVLLYGTHGIGKSTWGASSPKPIVLATEDGLDDLDVARTPLLRETGEVGKWLIELGKGGHDFETVVIDTVDWLEKLIWAATARDQGKDSIEEIGYGKGYTMALNRWEILLRMLDGCRAVGMNVVLLGHAKVERFSPPDADPYDRWQLDLHKGASALLQEWVDEVLFAKAKVNTITRSAETVTRPGDKHEAKRTVAIGSGERVVYTSEAPTHAAKRRIQMPEEIPLEWAEYQRYWPKGQQQQTGPGVAAGDITGMVADGHSKRKDKVAA